MADLQLPEELQAELKSFANYYEVPESATFWEAEKPSADYTGEFKAGHKLLDQRKVGDRVFYFWLRLADVAPPPEPSEPPTPTPTPTPAPVTPTPTTPTPAPLETPTPA